MSSLSQWLWLRWVLVHSAQQLPAHQIFISMKVFAGENPFDDSLPVAQRVKMMKGERPPRPFNPTLTDEVWTLVSCCWDQEPRLRPGMRRVLQDLAPSLLQSLHQSPKSSPEFQVALSQFYDSTERETCLSHLGPTELKKFVILLDDVRHHSGLSCLNRSRDFRLGTTD